MTHPFRTGINGAAGGARHSARLAGARRSPALVRRGQGRFWPAMAALVCLGSSACRGATIAEGKLVEVQAGGIVVRSGGTDKPVPITRSTTIVVTAKADASTVADGAPCLVDGTILAGKQIFQNAALQVVGPKHRVDQSGSHLRIDPKGTITLQNVPGVFRSGATPTFVVGPRVEHLEVTPEGRLRGTKAFNLSNQPIPLPAGAFGVEYNFGPNLQMAGKDADVRVVGDPNDPAGWTITIVRTEPLNLPPGAKKK